MFGFFSLPLMVLPPLLPLLVYIDCKREKEAVPQTEGHWGSTFGTTSGGESEDH